MQNEVLEVLRVIDYELRNDCFMDLDRGEFILCVLDNHSREFREVFGDLGRTVFHDQEVLISKLTQELGVLLNALYERLRS